MFDRDESHSGFRSGGAAAAALLCLAIFADPVAGQPIISGNQNRAFQWALSETARGVASKLADSSCRQIFSDFRDPTGRTLQENLDALQQTGKDYFDGLVFYSGNGRSPCDAEDIVAFTSPGSRVLFVCEPQFLRKTHSNPGLVAAILIHEELHSLGLGENPPSSRAITARVIARCGR